jgi:hypothetical protein
VWLRPGGGGWRRGGCGGNCVTLWWPINRNVTEVGRARAAAAGRGWWRWGGCVGNCVTLWWPTNRNVTEVGRAGAAVAG